MTEPKRTTLSEVHGIHGMAKLVWNQTWPLFQQPHAKNTFKLCFLMFVLFSIGHGSFMWFAIFYEEIIYRFFIIFLILFQRYPYFLTQMQDFTDGSHTLCSVVGNHLVKAKHKYNKIIYDSF